MLARGWAARFPGGRISRLHLDEFFPGSIVRRPRGDWEPSDPRDAYYQAFARAQRTLSKELGLSISAHPESSPISYSLEGVIPQRVQHWFTREGLLQFRKHDRDAYLRAHEFSDDDSSILVATVEGCARNLLLRGDLHGSILLATQMIAWGGSGSIDLEPPIRTCVEFHDIASYAGSLPLDGIPPRPSIGPMHPYLHLTRARLILDSGSQEYDDLLHRDLQYLDEYPYLDSLNSSLRGRVARARVQLLQVEYALEQAFVAFGRYHLRQADIERLSSILDDTLTYEAAMGDVERAHRLRLVAVVNLCDAETSPPPEAEAAFIGAELQLRRVVALGAANASPYGMADALFCWAYALERRYMLALQERYSSAPETKEQHHRHNSVVEAAYAVVRDYAAHVGVRRVRTRVAARLVVVRTALDLFHYGRGADHPSVEWALGDLGRIARPAEQAIVDRARADVEALAKRERAHRRSKGGSE